MPEPRNYRFADELQMATPSAVGTGLLIPTSPEAAESKAVLDIIADPNKAIEGLIEQQRKISSNKQKLISSIIQPMKGLSDKPTSGSISPAEHYANNLLRSINSDSGISEDAAISMLLETWPMWQKNGNTWETFEEFIKVAASNFYNAPSVIEWSKNLFETMQDGAPVFTPEYIMSVALDAVKTKNFTKYQNLLISLPFYKSVWSKQPVDDKAFPKATAQIGIMMQAIQTPTNEMEVAIRNMIARYKLISRASMWYKGMLSYIVIRDTIALEEISRIMKNRRFSIDDFETLTKLQMQRYETEKIIRSGLTGFEIVNPQPTPRKGSINLFKTVLSTGGTGTSAAGSGSGSTSGSSASTTSTPLSPSQQAASNQANALNREALLIDKNQEIIQKKIEKINSISEGKAKGLTGDLGLFSSLVTSGNVVKEINETLKLIADQRVLIKNAIAINDSWINRNPINSTTPDALAAHHQTLSMNRKRYQVLGIELDGMEQALKIQRIVLPKELEYFELKEEYDTNVEQLKAPISALMVNSLKTTTDNKGKTTTINTRVARPIAIKNAWETGKKIVNLLMQISQALQAGTGHSAMGESMAKNASNYYKAAIKQEVENNKMLMDNLRDIGLGGGQVNYTPVAVGKK
jgi:hypothetical protein